MITIHRNNDPSPETWRPPTVVLAGMGMGRRDLSVRTLEWIARAEVLIGGARHLESFPEHPGRRIPLKAPLGEALDEIDSISREERTVVLASGDPLFFGIGQRLIGRLGKERVLVFPNVTTVQALFARLGESWTDVKVLSLHGREGADEPPRWLREVLRHERLVLFTDPGNTPSRIATRLLETGIRERRLIVAEDLGLPSESIGQFSLEDASKRDFSPLNLVLIVSETSKGEKPDDSCDRPVMGIPEESFRHQAGLITKLEIRSVVLAQLQLKPDLVLWDVGAGSGSVSIEAARITRLRRVIAVEKDAGRYADLVDNIKRFRCTEVLPVHGNASHLLHEFPAPDRVFIGGSGGDLHAILEEVVKRLKPKGRVVQTVVTLDSLDSVRSFWRGKPFETSIVQLQVNRSVPIGKTLRLDALNPVFIVTNSSF